MKTFEKSGGRLFRIAGVFTIVCMAVIIIQAVFMKQAMDQVYNITVMEIPEDSMRPEIPRFYEALIPLLNPANIIGPLSGVLIAIAARYGIREGTKNIGDGINKSRNSVPTENGEK